MKRFLALASLIALSTALVAQQPTKADKKSEAKPKKPAVETFTDASKAGADFGIQGEYVGELPDGTKIGAQVIADGDGKFSGRAYIGGLPGDGWNGNDSIKLTGKTENGVTTIESPNAKASIVDGKIVAKTEDGQTLTMKRVTRKSPTEGAKPPAGAVVLFDGSSADAWDKGQLVEDKLLKMGINSKQKFSDYTLHIEFRTPFMPRARGQGRGNSGVYMQGRYEVQVLDSFGLEGKNNECGGIYGHYDPKVNMCFPPLSWQTYDIDYTAARFDASGKKTAPARMTVRHNGVIVQDDVELKGDTVGAVVKDGPDKGPIHLQDHGNPVYYRNIWIVEKK